ARIRVGPDSVKQRVWPAAEEEEPRVGRVGQHPGCVLVLFTKEAKAELADVLDSAFERVGKFVLHAKVEHAHFRVFQVGRNGAHPAKRACWIRGKWRKSCRAWQVRK